MKHRTGRTLTGTQASACRTVEEATRDIISLAREVYETPEVGFREINTARLVSERLRALGLHVETGIAKTGLKSVLKFDRPGPTIAVIGELDSLRVPGHVSSDPDTGAAHACGHHAQLGMMLGVAAALLTPDVREALCGAVAFIATPAEEFIDISDRLALREAGELEFLSGKQEMIRLGAFDDVDMAMMVHTTTGDGTPRFTVGGTSNAHVVHHVRFIGKSAHAGGAPDKGINALQAAMLALGAINTQRETFQEAEIARVHGIITRGGSAVNAVPSDVVYEGRVRANSLEAVAAVDEKVKRCYRAGALAMGAGVEITSVPGYLPLVNDQEMERLFNRNVTNLLGDSALRNCPASESRGGSTDMGDLSNIIPSIHPYTAAATGTGHGPDYEIKDYDLAVVAPAKVMAATVIDLLSRNASEAKRILEGFRPRMTKDEYIRSQRGRFNVERYSTPGT